MADPAPTDACQLSLCMIVRDAERTLAACLESIRPWVDEMIVVDTGSIDRTPQIAEQFGARLFHFPWCDDFSAARNKSLRHAQGRWIFWMDADDTIDADNGRQLQRLARAEVAPSVLGYVMQVRCPGPEDDRSSVTVVDQVKLFRNRPDLRFEGRLHEQILPAIRRAKGEILWSDLFVVHSGYDYSPEGQAKKRDRDLRLLELDLADRPNHPFVLFNLGMTYSNMGQTAKAIEALKQCVIVSHPDESHLRKAYALLASAFQQDGQHQVAWSVCQTGRRLFPEDAELLYREGLLCQQFGRLDDAARAFRQLLEAEQPRYFSSRDHGITGFRTRFRLASVYRGLGDRGGAEEQLRAVLAEQPDFTPAWIELGDLLVEQDKLECAEKLAEQMAQAPKLAMSAQLLRSRIHLT